MRVWNCGRSSVSERTATADLCFRIKGNSGRKNIDPDEMKSAVAAAPTHKRGTFQKLECAKDISKSAVQSALKNVKIVRQSRRVKPYI